MRASSRSTNRSVDEGPHALSTPSPPASAVGRAGTCVYPHADSVPAGDRVGSVVVIWPSSTNGSERHLGAGELVGVPRQLVDRVDDVDRAGSVHHRVRPRDRRRQRPVDLHRAGVVLEPLDVTEHPLRHRRRSSSER